MIFELILFSLVLIFLLIFVCTIQYLELFWLLQRPLRYF